MLARICRNRLLFEPSSTTSGASVIGVPVRTNAAICREKCMISCLGTRCGASSSSENFFFCLTDLTSRFCINSWLRSASSLGASSASLTSDPSGPTATKRKVGMEPISLGQSEHVDGAQHLGDGGLLLDHEPDGL